MKRYLRCISIILSVYISSPVEAEESPINVRAITSFDGQCRLLIVQRFLACKPGVMWQELRNGRGSISFFRENYTYSLSGGGARRPNREEYYQPIDRLRVYENGKIFRESEMEGECRFRLNSLGTNFFFIKCDVYNPKKGLVHNFYLENIKSFNRKGFGGRR